MSTKVDVAIIGAGPYGLSLAAYLSAAGIEFRIFGKSMSSWKWNMPPGMLLKSHPWSSSLYDPMSSFTLRQFCAEQKIHYHDLLMPLPVETFAAYGEAFQSRFVPNVEDKTLVGCDLTPQGLRIKFDDGDTLVARHVVVAVGIVPFRSVPAVLDRLPAENVSHSCDYGSLKQFGSRNVLVLGSGSSAIDLAALLHEQGASVSLVARATKLVFHDAPAKKRTLVRRLAYPVVRPFLYPGSGIGSGWVLKACADAPYLFHTLPEPLRLRLVKTLLGPSGGPFMKDRILGKFSLFLGRGVEAAEVRSGKVHLTLTSHDGKKETLEADHLIAATGYKIDLGRLTFLNPRLIAQIRSVEATPILSANYETSIPGLHFIGVTSANSFGPVNRFVFGAIHPSRRLTRYLTRALTGRSIGFSKASTYATVTRH